MMIVGGDGKFISIPDIKETRIKSTYAIIIKKYSYNMEHLTHFELILIGACIATFCFGFSAFIKDVLLQNFNRSES